MLVIGHQGASARFPANTLAAFEGAVAQGADGVELDVRRTSTGDLVICHDDTLPDGRVLVDTAFAELPPDLTDLGSALDVCAPLSLVNIEIKNWPDDRDFDATEELAAAVVALLDVRGELGDDRYLISAFHLPTIDRVRELAAGLATAWVLGAFRHPAKVIDRAASHGHNAVHPHHLHVDEAFVTLAHEAGLQVTTWTCDDDDRIRWLAKIGVDGVITNEPDKALRALGRTTSAT